MQLLPAELKRHIVMLSSDSPSSLAALARTHSDYQREAEKALYHTLVISAYREDCLKCMETLATNSEKAALVHILIVEYNRGGINNERVTSYLSKSLINMHSLSDFRIRSRLVQATGEMVKGLGKILCQGHFRLQTLYCDSILNISQIIKGQTGLQILGLYIYNPTSSRSVLEALKELHKTQLFLPIVLTLETTSFPPLTQHIGIFPAYCSVDRCATIPQVLIQSFRKDEGDHMLARTDNIRKLSIYLFDSSDTPSIYALAKDMAVSFPKLNWLNLCFERRCEIPQQVEEEFSFLSDLRGITTHVLP